MNPENNFNWMPLSEALETMHIDTHVWFRCLGWRKDIGLICSQLIYLEPYKKDQGKLSIIVCRALMPEVPSWEEQSE